MCLYLLSSQMIGVMSSVVGNFFYIFDDVAAGCLISQKGRTDGIVDETDSTDQSYGSQILGYVHILFAWPMSLFGFCSVLVFFWRFF